jgi:hypothetical protein
MLRKTIVTGCAGIALTLAAGSAWSAANFENDVNTAINKGIEYLDDLGAFSGYPTCSGNDGARGMALLVVLEKRASGNLADPPQGYVGASEADKTLMRKAVACILYSAKFSSQYAYYDGNWLMGLALYSRTGGPDKGAADTNLLALADAINLLTDRTITAQGAAGSGSQEGGWYYSGPGTDSSTTQFATAGLGGAKAYYLAKGDPGSRVAKINAALALAKGFYARSTRSTSDNGSCSTMDANDRGHGYHPTNNPSLQQTASGMWVQQLGGATVNDPAVQAYLSWLRNHYRWQDLDSMGNSWPNYSYWYYMWSGIKGLLTIEESGIAPDAGNLGADSLGLLGPADDANTSDALPGTCAVRQLHRDPATVARNSIFGSDTGGFYADESQSVYFDFASSIIGHQCTNGSFTCNTAPGAWDSTAGAAWALLVLQRATGGACADANNDGICDGDEGGPPPAYAKCDVDGSGRITTADLRAMVGAAKKRKKLPKNSAVAPADQAANVVTAMYDPKKGGWFSSTGDTEINIADFTRCIFLQNGI